MAIILNVFVSSRFALASPQLVLASPHVVLASPQVDLASPQVDLASPQIAGSSSRVAGASSQSVLALLYVVPLWTKLALALVQAEGMSLRTVLASMQTQEDDFCSEERRGTDFMSQREC